ncbi:MAG TPA: DUF1559 domain-containing protein [Abditibacteriaceae bacterium]|jgi:prepilin-type N-terminal cleavage/methylation domain-containing protein/prepilin-type processing-associated H-X9-DG protein
MTISTKNGGQTIAHTRPGKPSGFTLIELLIVIAIIAILSSILFPVFASAREKARQSSCQSNLKQFMLAINMYTQDYDEGMPFAWKIKGQLGSKITQTGEEGAGKTPQGLWVSLLPYAKSQEIFRCPNDPKFWGTKAASKSSVTAVTVTAGKYSYYDALGQSYKFSKDNFSLPPEIANITTAEFNGLESGTSAGTKDRGDMMMSPAGPTPGTYVLPPTPMRVSFFARPSETRVIRDFNAPWEEFEGTPNGFEEGHASETATHKQGINVAFADGHVKFVASKATFNTFCDGPTLSPSRNSATGQPFSAGDGSCNTAGMERKKP